MYDSSKFVGDVLDVHGRTPSDRQPVLETIDEVFRLPVGSFRAPTERLVGLRS